MKSKYYLVLLLGVFSMASCDTSLNLEADPDLTITTEKKEYKVGEEVNFQLTGNPGIITFYSGEIGNDYDYRDGRTLPAGDITVTMSTSVNYGVQPDQFSILVSTDFNGKYTIDDIKAATWTDITNRFTLATNATYISGGQVNVSDLVVDGKPMYFCLRYIYDPTKGTGRTWAIRDFAVKSNTVLGLTTLATQTTAGFGLYYYGPKETTGRSGITSTTITLRSNAAGNTADYTEDWCVSSGMEVGSKDMGPDRPLNVKGYSDAHQDSYSYTYTTAGSYKARFVATNATIKEARTVVKEVDLEIVP
ncbi:DUF5017 domain-containing protein [Pedobacter sp. BS3]|uniref:DUF5017 domain-containing protein n=1 Tax=Pedobacter sp. BS3 TaxID=2567937 RepID=UPI0016599E2F|nr:DUF5017 domain-containing protein [Pedobacter sp. BS3]